MNTTYIINQLESNQAVFLSLFKTDSPDEHLWKPEPNKWCLLEIICHLVDEEILDFRARVQTALDPEKFPFFSIDPVGWVLSKNYMGSDVSEKVMEWSSERERSIEWLRSLENPDWTSSLEHQDVGKLTAGLFLANWLAHDQLHIRQINRLKRAYLEQVSDEDLSYAGNW